MVDFDDHFESPFDSKVLPQNFDAEQTVLANVIYVNEIWYSIADRVTEQDFYHQKHKLIFKAIQSCIEEGRACDTIIISNWLEKHNQLRLVGGIEYLLELFEKRTGSTKSTVYHADIVREKSILRQLMKVASDISNSVVNPQGLDAVQLLDKAEKLVFDIAEQGARGQKGFSIIESVISSAMKRIEMLFEKKGAITGISTGFPDLDNLTSGLQNSDLIIIAGRPSMGKCLEKSSRITLSDGSIATIEEIYHKKKAQLLTLGQDWKFHIAEASTFVDDGMKPVFKVITRLGRSIETTLTHPFLTLQGWKALCDISVGNKIAIPREINIFGKTILPECNIKLLAYLIGDGNLTQSLPKFTNANILIKRDFIEAAENFGGIQIKEIKKKNGVSEFSISSDRNFIKACRQKFANILCESIDSKNLSHRKFAIAIDVSPSSVCYWTKGKYVPKGEMFRKLCTFLELKAEELINYDISITNISKNAKNSLTLWLEELGLWGKNSHTKFIPDIVFTLTRPQIALFLNRLFATDGWACILSCGQAQLGYCSVSEILAKQVQHLLLRFGIIACLKKRTIRYEETLRSAWQLDITDSYSIEKFVINIGIFSKEDNLLKIQQILAHKKKQTNKDLIPIDIWTQIEESKGDESWTHLAKRANIQGYSNIHVGKRSLSRKRLLALAESLNNLSLKQLANSDIYWDEIVSIELQGLKQVYDLTIPETHNFIANDICVHNTAFAMNIAEHVAIEQKIPVAIFSMEMSQEQLGMRLLSSVGKVELQKVRSGNFEDDDWGKISAAVTKLRELPLFIDDTAALSPIDLRAKVRRLARELNQKDQQLGLVVIDYLQLMQVPDNTENRALEVSEISRSLKALAKELNIPIVALSQLNRSLEQRTDKRPVMSDLRESGSLEQDSDLIIFIYRDEVYHENSEDKGKAEIIIKKQRNGPTGKIILTFLAQFTKFESYTPDRGDYS